jgi:hypothetical protein
MLRKYWRARRRRYLAATERGVSELSLRYSFFVGDEQAMIPDLGLSHYIR